MEFRLTMDERSADEQDDLIENLDHTPLPMSDILTLDQSTSTLKLLLNSGTNRDYGYDPLTQDLIIEAHLHTGTLSQDS